MTTPNQRRRRRQTRDPRPRNAYVQTLALRPHLGDRNRRESGRADLGASYSRDQIECRLHTLAEIVPKRTEDVERR